MGEIFHQADRMLAPVLYVGDGGPRQYKSRKPGSGLMEMSPFPGNVAENFQFPAGVDCTNVYK